MNKSLYLCMGMHFRVFIVFMAISIAVQAQLETSRWYFGSFAGLDFRNGYPVADTQNTVMNVEGGSASIADKDGNLLFFTDGRTIWDRSYRVMVHGDSLAGDPEATQSCLIVPQPGSGSVYYVFTLDKAPPAGNHGLNYSIVDMLKESGNGAVTEKNIPLLRPASEQLTAARHANGIDVWVITHGWDSNTFYAYLVTANGVDPEPVESPTGLIQEGSGEGALVGSMKVSPGGTRLALANYRMSLFEFFSFDPAYGVVSNPKHSFTNFRGAYGIEFSPDSRKVYGSTYYTNNDFPQSYIFQFNAVDPNVGETGIPIPTSVDAPFKACAMQLAPDGRIYVSKYGDDHLGVILYPNRDSAKCDYLENWVSLEGRILHAGMPNFMQSYLRVPPMTYYGHCAGSDIFFQLVNSGPVDSVVWDFNDKLSGENNFSRLLNPVHVFTEAGTYSVRLQLYHQGNLYRTSWDIQVDPVPDVYLGEDRILYPGAYLILDPGPDYSSYLWQDSSSQQTFFVDKEGSYSVIVSNEFHCKNIDKVDVYYLPLTVPTAFTPNEDGINDEFGPIMPTEGVSNYHLTVTDRWGGRVYEASHPFQRWDGTLKGKPCPPGQYVWIISFDAQKELTRLQQVRKQGTVQLLR